MLPDVPELDCTRIKHAGGCRPEIECHDFGHGVPPTKKSPNVAQPMRLMCDVRAPV